MPNDVRACRLMTPRRSPRGLTLIELLISTFIMSFAGAAVAGLLLLNNVTQVRVNNKIDNLNMARTAFERIGRDARMARNVGDITGTSVLLYAGPPEVYGTEGSSSFPASNNPLYNGGQSPPGGWPTLAWGAQPYTLSPQTLIIQIPVFGTDGFPMGIDKDSYGAGNPSVNLMNMDTLIYHVLADPDHEGQYMLQVAGFPGTPTALKMLANPPQTLVKGIVGPLDPVSGQPKVFQYLDKYGTGVPLDTVANANLSNCTGIVVNMELESGEANASGKSIVGLKTEVFMRNNTLSQVSKP